MRRFLISLAMSIALAVLAVGAAAADGIPAPWGPVGP